MEKERRNTSDCIPDLNKTGGNGTVHYNKSVPYRSHGVGQCLEQEQLRVQWKARQWKIAKWFFFQNFHLCMWRLFRPGISWLLLRQINKLCLSISLCLSLTHTPADRRKPTFLLVIVNITCWNSVYPLGKEKYRTVWMLSRFNMEVQRSLHAFLLQSVYRVVQCTGFAVILTWYKSWIYYYLICTILDKSLLFSMSQ